MISLIENKAGIIFKKIGTPQPEEIIWASADGVLEVLDAVNEEVLVYFEDAAEALIESKGAKRAV